MLLPRRPGRCFRFSQPPCCYNCRRPGRRRPNHSKMSRLWLPRRAETRSCSWARSQNTQKGIFLDVCIWNKTSCSRAQGGGARDALVPPCALRARPGCPAACVEHWGTVWICPPRLRVMWLCWTPLPGAWGRMALCFLWAVWAALWPGQRKQGPDLLVLPWGNTPLQKGAPSSGLPVRAGMRWGAQSTELGVPRMRGLC